MKRFLKTWGVAILVLVVCLVLSKTLFFLALSFYFVVFLFYFLNGLAKK